MRLLMASLENTSSLLQRDYYKFNNTEVSPPSPTFYPFLGSIFPSPNPYPERHALGDLGRAAKPPGREGNLLLEFHAFSPASIILLAPQISHYRECFQGTQVYATFQANIEILGLVIVMLNTVDQRQFDRPFQEVLRDAIQANANQVARRCRVLIDNEKHAKNPLCLVTLVKLLTQEIEADKTHYSVEVSMCPM